MPESTTSAPTPRDQGGPQRRVAEDSLETFALKIAMAGVGFVSSALIARGLGPAGRGEYYLPVVAAATMATFCNLGVDQGNVYLFGTRRIDAARLWAQNNAVALVAGTTGLALLLAAPWTFPSVFEGTSFVRLLTAGLTVPLTIATLLTAGLLTLRGRVTWQFRAGLASGLLQLALIAGLWLAGRLTVLSVLVANLVMVATTWTLVVLGFRGRGASWVRWDASLLRETLAHSVPLYLGSVFLFLHLRADIFMLSALGGATLVGWYSISVLLAEAQLIATDSLSLALLPRQMTPDLRGAAEVACRGVRVTLLLAAVLGPLGALAGLLVVPLAFGTEFSAAYPPFVALLPGMACLGAQRISGGAIVRAGRPWRIAGIHAATTILNVLLNLLWIPRWGALGAAAASSLSYLLSCALFLAWLARLAGRPATAAFVPRRDDVSLAWSAARQALGSVWPGRPAAGSGGTR